MSADPGRQSAPGTAEPASAGTPAAEPDGRAGSVSGAAASRAPGGESAVARDASPADEARATTPAAEPVVSAAGRTLVVRPRKVRKIAWACAVVLVAVFAVVAVLLRSTPTGAYFRVSDQVSMLLLGVILAGCALLFTRPRLRILPDGVEVRNVLTTRTYHWPEITSVAFPEGAQWARLELPDDEYVTIMAIQAADGAYAVKAMRALRAAYRKATR